MPIRTRPVRCVRVSSKTGSSVPASASAQSTMTPERCRVWSISGLPFALGPLPQVGSAFLRVNHLDPLVALRDDGHAEEPDEEADEALGALHGQPLGKRCGP